MNILEVHRAPLVALFAVALCNAQVSAQYLGYYVGGTWRAVQFDRLTHEMEAKYVDGQLWRTPIALAGGGLRTGLVLDGGIGRHFSIVFSPALIYSQMTGTFEFGSETPPFETDFWSNLLYPINGTWYSDKGTRQLDVFNVESSLALKVRVTHGLVIRLGASLLSPVYAIQRTKWSRTIKDDIGHEHMNQLDETVSGDPDLFLGGLNSSYYGGFAELGYEFKNGFGVFLRGTRSGEMSRELHYDSRPSAKSNWRAYALDFGLCFRLIRNSPSSNWGGVKPLSKEDIKQLRRDERRGQSRGPLSADSLWSLSTPANGQPSSSPAAAAAPEEKASPPAAMTEPPTPTSVEQPQEKTLPPVVSSPQPVAPVVVDAQYAGCAVALERTEGTVTLVWSEEVGSTPQAGLTALRVQWSGRADGKRWLWSLVLPASGAPPPIVRATLAWGDGRRMVIASDLRPVEAEVRPDGNTWYGMHLTDQEWRTIRAQMPNELTLVAKSGPFQVVWMEEERRALEDQSACLDQWFLANASTAMPSSAPSPVGSGTMPPLQAEHPVDTKQQVNLSGGGAETNEAAPPPGQHVQQGSLSPNAGTTTSSPDEGRLAYKVITERPEAFGAVHVYTVLHVFSSSNALDTFRVVTRNSPMGGLKHELWISTLPGATYREELYPVPLEGALDAGKNAGEEMEMLRVRMALAPGAFQTNPISVDDWRLSGSRASRDLLYDLSIAEFETVFFEKPAIGFHFQSDAETRRELVYSNTLRRIVNVAPQ